MQQLCSTFNVSQRRACRVLDQPRATQRLRPRERPEEKRLVQRMLEPVSYTHLTLPTTPYV